jgi:hypothetical protein
LKDVILGALSDAGGEAWLVEQARKSPVAFMALIGRVLPLQVNDGGADPMVQTVVNHIYESASPVTRSRELER